ncbi:MAG: D-alanyl-D-alanine carboxypeptidase/D-alanyl-D-alanine-endopeptidase [Candidatus Eremiobacteraeota bacterium]|nr:D-alanyl-D-alanine carboxypeptidase/D-alanyl-D-alanine-endopeptidase [Candidatus Eremiobacteraeota bacterium]
MKAHVIGALLLWALAPLPAGAQQSISQRVDAVLKRPEFVHASFGVEFYDLDAKRPIYVHDAQKFFAPASTTKLVTEGTVLSVLGPDFRFHTRVYATAPIRSGVLDGDLVLVGSGDPDLSNRIQPDGTLAFRNEDHAYDGDAVPGNPLAVIDELANAIAQRVKTLNGRVLVDATLFPEGDRESGTGTTISPIVVNDNVVDVTIGPGASVGSAATMNVSPQTGYVHFVNQVTTTAKGRPANVNFVSDVAAADGTRTVTVGGTIPAGDPAQLNAYAVPTPSAFAQVALTEALQAAGVTVRAPTAAAPPDFSALKSAYTDGAVVAEHVSPPLSEDVKITLKVSQNLHADLGIYWLGVYKAHATHDVVQSGFDVERDFLTGAHLSLDGSSAADGAGTAFFTPEFMVAYLQYMRTNTQFAAFYRGLPILGVDGTLWNIQTHSPAAGKVHAKTGTDDQPDLLNRKVTVSAKGLAGYVTSRHGRHIAFAVYVNNVDVKDDAAVTAVAGQTMGELAAMAYDL